MAAGFVSLAVIAVVFSIFGAYYYLRIVKLMYFDDPDDISPIVCGQNTRVVLSFNGPAVLVLGLMPGALMTMCMTARAAVHSDCCRSLFLAGRSAIYHLVQELRARPTGRWCCN